MTTAAKAIRNSNRPKQNRLISVTLALAFLSISGCEKSSRMSVTTDNPPRITLSGDARFDWLEVRGPLPEKMDD